MTSKRYERQIRFFGKDGQNIIQKIHVAVIGIGGTGSHIVQQLAFLGVSAITIIDPDNLELTNMNRLIGVKYDDLIGTPKVNIMERLILSINPSIKIFKIKDNFISELGFRAIKKADFVFSCVDNDGARLVLNEFCLAYKIPFIDVATEIFIDPLEYGGQVISILDGNACLFCLGYISPDEARKYLQNMDARKDEESIYGISKDLLENSGPSVVTINGIISSIALTEFLVEITGIRKANKIIKYYGNRGITTVSIEKPWEDCYYCKQIRGIRNEINIERYLPSTNN